MEQSKACTKCGQIQPFNQFYKHATNADGLFSWCKLCHKIIKRISRHKNMAHYNQRARENYAKNAERYRASAVLYRASNPEKVAATFKKWAQANPEKQRERGARRRARREQNGVYLVTNKERKRFYSSPCFYCGSHEQIQIDHVIPIARGGRHSIGNLVAACFKCNNQKRARFIMEWRLKKSGVRRSLEQIERDRNGTSERSNTR